jgi:hypothetical protein
MLWAMGAMAGVLFGLEGPGWVGGGLLAGVHSLLVFYRCATTNHFREAKARGSIREERLDGTSCFCVSGMGFVDRHARLLALDRIEKSWARRCDPAEIRTSSAGAPKNGSGADFVAFLPTVGTRPAAGHRPGRMNAGLRMAEGETIPGRLNFLDSLAFEY